MRMPLSARSSSAVRASRRIIILNNTALRRHGPTTIHEPTSQREQRLRITLPEPKCGTMSDLREQHALREHSFIHNTEARLDDFIAQGRAVLDDLVEQRTVLKGTQRRLLDAANTLGLSRDVIGWIERRRCVARVTVSAVAHVSDCVQYTGYVYLLRRSNLYFCLFLPYMEVSWVRLLCSGGSRLDIPL